MFCGFNKRARSLVYIFLLIVIVFWLNVLRSWEVFACVATIPFSYRRRKTACYYCKCETVAFIKMNNIFYKNVFTWKLTSFHIQRGCFNLHLYVHSRVLHDISLFFRAKPRVWACICPLKGFKWRFGRFDCAETNTYAGIDQKTTKYVCIHGFVSSGIRERLLWSLLLYVSIVPNQLPGTTEPQSIIRKQTKNVTEEETEGLPIRKTVTTTTDTVRIST